jgi:crotonobetainyl-CoA:carnitine CoA-transferase CaiB-like acyl-CoA transferase
MMGFLKDYALHFGLQSDDARFRPPLISTGTGQLWAREQIANCMKNFTLAEIEAKMEQHGLFGGPVLELHEAWNQPQAVHNGSIVTHDVPHLGVVREARPAPQLSATPMRIAGGPPMYGEHTEEVLLELGWSQEEVSGLFARGVLGPTPEEQAAAREARRNRQR